MISITRLNGEAISVNAFQIEVVESCPDTRVTLTSGRQLYVRETPEEVRRLMLTWFRAMHTAPPPDAKENESWT
jgi:flagellar protein FlbD